MNFEVENDEPRNRYSAQIDGQEAVIEYEKSGDHTLDLRHTFVPPALRGQGIAEELARQALADIRRRGYKLIPTCQFIQGYLESHPADRDLVA